MKTKPNNTLLAALGLLAALTVGVQGQTTTWNSDGDLSSLFGIYDAGEDAAGNILPDDVVDSNWAVSVNGGPFAQAYSAADHPWFGPTGRVNMGAISDTTSRVGDLGTRLYTATFYIDPDLYIIDLNSSLLFELRSDDEWSTLSPNITAAGADPNDFTQVPQFDNRYLHNNNKVFLNGNEAEWIAYEPFIPNIAPGAHWGQFDSSALVMGWNTFTVQHEEWLGVQQAMAVDIQALTLTTIPVPEPSGALLVGLAGALAILRRRRAARA